MEGYDPALGQGIVCGAHNFGPGDLVVVILPGGVLPGNFGDLRTQTYGHVSAGMICSVRELGIGTTTTASSCCCRTRGARRRRVALLGLDEEVIEFEINPDRASRPLPCGVAREAGARLLGVPSSTPPSAPARGRWRRLGEVVVDDPAGCPVCRTAGERFRLAAPTPDFIKRRVEQAGMRSISLPSTSPTTSC